MFKKENQKGALLFLTIVVLAMMASALLSLLAINLGQTRTILNIGDSVVAFYSADSGIERALFEIFKGGDLGWYPDMEDGIDDKGHYRYPRGAGDIYRGVHCDSASYWEAFGLTKYNVCVSGSDEAVLYATGDYRGTQRKVEINLRQ